MTIARRQVLHEELAGGFFHFLDTGVEIGSNGIKGLVHHIPLQDTWGFSQTAGGHQFTTEEDIVYSRQTHRITAVLTGAKSSQIFRRLLLPRDFGSFQYGAIQMVVYCNVVTGPTLKFSLLQDGLADLDQIDILPTTVSSYYLVNLTPTWTYSPGDELLLKIEYATDDAGQYADISDLGIQYVSARGNV